MSVDLLQRETTILQALVDRHWDLLAAELHDDFVITTAGRQAGVDRRGGRAACAAPLRGPVPRRTRRRSDHGRADALDEVGHLEGRAFQGDFRYTDVWHADESGRQRLAVRHATLVPSP